MRVINMKYLLTHFSFQAAEMWEAAVAAELLEVYLMSRCFVKSCSESEISRDTGWE
jgi:hypothetical protein